jgi:drug/metabolite transporter (DMT)-like permease
MKGHWVAHLALFAVNLIYGANYIIAKGVMPKHVGPSGFILMRVFGALLLFVPLLLFKFEKVARKDMVRMAICGLFGVCLNQLFFFEGLNLTSTIDASIIMTFNPILVLLLSAIILKDKITKQKSIGVAIGMVGAILLILSSAKSGANESGLLGNMFIFINAMSYGVYLVLVKPLMTKYKPVTVITYVFLWGSLLVLCSPFAVSEFMEVEWAAVPDMMRWSILYVIVATTFFAYLLNIFALKLVSPAVSSSYIYLQPLIALLFTWMYGVFISPENIATKIDLSWDKGAYALLIFTGVFLISRRKNLLGQQQ